MERLTGRDEKAGTAFYIKCFDEPCVGGGCEIKACTHNEKVCERLAAYEDTGLSPEQIKEICRKFSNSVIRIWMRDMFV